MSQESIVNIKVLDHLYKIKCSAKDAVDLQEAAYYVDAQMRKIRQSNPTTSVDRMAVVTALNIYVLKKQKNQSIDAMNQKIIDLQRRIEEKLAEKEPIVV
jgi:cell division protein ZapA (FtsZ GTPase activity inhibitor)